MATQFRRRSILGIATALAFGGAVFLPIQQASAADKVIVFAAASLKNALDAIATTYKAKKGTEIAVSYAGSSALAKQIESGAPADIFISADLDWMDHVQKANLIKTETRVNLLGNTLVLVAPKDSAAMIEIKQGFDLAGAVGDGKLAMADVKAVPAGKYGKASLERLGAWSAVESKVAQAENVRTALALVASGEAPFGIVYRTDATAEPKVKVVATFPKDSHPPIIYPIAQIAASTNPAAADFLKYVESPVAAAVFEKQGFTILK